MDCYSPTEGIRRDDGESIAIHNASCSPAANWKLWQCIPPDYSGCPLYTDA